MLSFNVVLNHHITDSFAISNVKDLKDIGFNEKLSSKIDTEAVFYNQDGKEEKIGNYLNDGKPLVLSLVYFKCPRVCQYASEGVLEVINDLDSFELGKDFKILTVSFNPEESAKISAKKSKLYRNKLADFHKDKNSWSFLTGDEENILKLTNSLGFRFKKDGEEFAHPSGLIIIAPDGTISRYLYGIQHNAKDLKLSLIEATDGKVGSSKALNKVLLFCYQFDPIGKRYALKALNIVKAGGVLTLIILVAFLVKMWKREKKIN